MALQKNETFATGVTAPEAYHVIMQASINKADNQVEAEVWVYHDMAARLGSYEPLNRFRYTIYDNAAERQDTTYYLHVYRQGEIAIKLGDEVLSSVTVTDDLMQSDTFLQDVADDLQHESLSIKIKNNLIEIKAIGPLEGSAGVELSVHGSAMQILDWIRGSDAKASDMEAFTPEALSAEGVNLQQQIYEHMKDKDPRYVDAIDV